MNKSIWKEYNKLYNNIERHPKLTNNLETDVLVIGGGLVGVLIAYFVKKKKIKNAAFNLLRQQKRGKLVDELKRLGLEALTAEEIARFDEKVK